MASERVRCASTMGCLAADTFSVLSVKTVSMEAAPGPAAAVGQDKSIASSRPTSISRSRDQGMAASTRWTRISTAGGATSR